ncbi:hypothetical protein B0H14DRAFT_2601543 [Mycena olivaceomarginata]|nr:hypothetical protein B0H14DRAFT_2601543 [Mycena olivaceomarginata]
MILSHHPDMLVLLSAPPMCALSAFPLDDDIVAHIMTFCSTFGSLHSATLVCHTFHRVFTYNIVGPALPQALRLLRYPYPNDKASAAIDPIILATNCPEEHDTASLITAKEKILLQVDSELDTDSTDDTRDTDKPAVDAPSTTEQNKVPPETKADEDGPRFHKEKEGFDGDRQCFDTAVKLSRSRKRAKELAGEEVVNTIF